MGWGPVPSVLLGTLAPVTLIRGRGAGGRTEGFSCEKPGKSKQNEKSADEGVVSTRPFQDPRGRCQSGRSHGIQEAVTCGAGILLNDRREASSHGTGAGSGPSHCEGIGRGCQMTAPQGCPPRKGAVPREKACRARGLALCYQMPPQAWTQGKESVARVWSRHHRQHLVLGSGPS